jgi:hypothetical protein
LPYRGKRELTLTVFRAVLRTESRPEAVARMRS